MEETKGTTVLKGKFWHFFFINLEKPGGRRQKMEGEACFQGSGLCELNTLLWSLHACIARV